MKTIRFSIVTASYNSGRFLEQTLRSVIDQAEDGPGRHALPGAGLPDEAEDFVFVQCQRDTVYGKIAVTAGGQFNRQFLDFEQGQIFHGFNVPCALNVG